MIYLASFLAVGSAWAIAWALSELIIYHLEAHRRRRQESREATARLVHAYQVHKATLERRTQEQLDEIHALHAREMDRITSKERRP